jgi:hypothetical protein
MAMQHVFDEATPELKKQIYHDIRFIADEDGKKLTLNIFLDASHAASIKTGGLVWHKLTDNKFITDIRSRETETLGYLCSDKKSEILEMAIDRQVKDLPGYCKVSLTVYKFNRDTGHFKISQRRHDRKKMKFRLAQVQRANNSFARTIFDLVGNEQNEDEDVKKLTIYSLLRFKKKNVAHLDCVIILDDKDENLISDKFVWRSIKSTKITALIGVSFAVGGALVGLLVGSGAQGIVLFIMAIKYLRK